MRRWLTFAGAMALLGATAFVAGKALSQRETPVRRCSLDGLADRFALTAKQRKQCAESDEEFRQKRMELVAELADAQARLMDVLRQPKPKQQDIDAALRAVSETQAKLQRAVVDHLLRLKSVLTPKQQEELFESLGQHMCGGLGLGHGASEAGSCGMHKQNRLGDCPQDGLRRKGGDTK